MIYFEMVIHVKWFNLIVALYNVVGAFALVTGICVTTRDEQNGANRYQYISKLSFTLTLRSLCILKFGKNTIFFYKRFFFLYREFSLLNRTLSMT